MMGDVLAILASAGATWFFAILFRTPRRAQWVCALLGGCAYTIFFFLGGITGIFLGSLFLTIGSEYSARWMKLTSTTFIFCALIPLVPGVGMYETMLYLVLGDASSALSSGLLTISQAGSIAAAIAVGSSFTRLAGRRRILSKKNGQGCV